MQGSRGDTLLEASNVAAIAAAGGKADLAGMRAAKLAEDLQAQLAAKAPTRDHSSTADGGERNLPLMRMILWLHRWHFLRSGVLRFMNSAVQFLPPVFLSALLGAVEQGHLEAGVKAALGLFVVLCVKVLVENQLFFYLTSTSLRVRTMLQATIYKKSLHLPEAAASVPPVTLMQVDTGKAETLAYSAHTLWDGIFQVSGYSFLLVRYLGVAGLAGLVILFACFPVNAVLQRKLSSLNRDVLRANEARVTQTSEILGGIRAIRQLGWEDLLEPRVNKLRDLELAALRRRTNVSAYLSSYFFALPPFMIAVVLFAYAATNGMGGVAGFRPSTVFTALAVLNQIRFPLLFYPYALDALAEGRAALRRIGAFLSLEEAPRRERRQRTEAEAKPAATAAASGHSAAPPRLLQVPAGRYPLGGPRSTDAPTLVVPEGLTVQPGELVAVVGAVGSGKSTLVQALLGELPAEGLDAPPGSVAYCAQKPWIPSGKFRDVVAGGGARFKSAAFEQACEAALVDFAGPDDEVGSGTLSGGQQARAALARAIYVALAGDQDGEMPLACVLDDVTAALDPQAAAVVVERAIFGALQRQTRIVVTSDTGPFLKRCDRVLVMEAKGRDLVLKADGRYADLVREGLLAKGLGEAASPSYQVPREQQASSDSAEHSEEAADSAAKEPEAPAAGAAKRRFTQAEERATGAVPLNLYKRYFRNGRSPLLLGAAGGAIVATYLATVAQQWFIGVWTADAALKRGLAFYVAGVCFLGLFASGLTFGRTLMTAAFARRASRSTHRQLAHTVLVRATTRHFDANPLGRLLQRFAKDLEQVDSSLPSSLQSAMSCTCSVAGSLGTITVVNPWFLVLLGPMSVVYVKALQLYRPSARELKRLEALSRSPVYNEQAEAAEGVATIRQLGLEETVSARALRAIDENTAVSFSAKVVDRWFCVHMELLGNCIVLTSGLFGLAAATAVASSPWAAARAAVSITQALSVVGLLNWTVRTLTDVETSFSSFQRVVYSTDTPEQEAPRMLPSDSELRDAGWPQQGQVSFNDVVLSYRDDLPPVLRGATLDIAPGQRVGIVGRTGSGKSTMLRVLLRIVEISDPQSGAVTVDDQDIRDIGLDLLRSGVTVIPQENFILTGSVRENVDPRSLRSDEEVRHALQAASLGHWDFNRQVGSGAGGGMSPGERQLLGIARAVVRRSRLVALDEVTSRVDEETDRKVQRALRKLPAGTTLLVVSHRLQTLEDYDMVVVMDGGRVVEVGNPRELRQQPGSRFAQLLTAELSGEQQGDEDVEKEEMVEMLLK